MREGSLTSVSTRVEGTPPTPRTALQPAPFQALVVIPTYNELANLPRVLDRVLSLDSTTHVLVVDDNSPDGTGELADRIAADSSRVHVLHRPGKEGLGMAYVAGFKWGLERDYQVLVEMDADLSHPPEALPEFWLALADADVVVGSRYVGGRVNVVNWPISRLLISLFGSWYARVITGLSVRDTTGGFNAFHRRVIESMDLGKIQSNGYTFQIELKFRAWKSGYSIREVPIVFTERDSGESKMSKKIVREAVWKVWKLRLLHMFGRL